MGDAEIACARAPGSADPERAGQRPSRGHDPAPGRHRGDRGRSLHQLFVIGRSLPGLGARRDPGGEHPRRPRGLSALVEIPRGGDPADVSRRSPSSIRRCPSGPAPCGCASSSTTRRQRAAPGHLRHRHVRGRIAPDADGALATRSSTPGGTSTCSCGRRPACSSPRTVELGARHRGPGGGDLAGLSRASSSSASGVFVIDSESRLRAAGSGAMGGHEHGADGTPEAPAPAPPAGGHAGHGG